jgi:hypothetical protein
MEKVFKKEIAFISKQPVMETTKENKVGDVIEIEVTKEAVFKELSRTDRTQRDLVFSIMGTMKQTGSNKATIDSEGIATLTDKAIELLLIADAKGFTETDKAEFLNDNIAVLNFGLWFFSEKVTPFFAKLKVN